MVVYDATIGNVLHALNTAALLYYVAWIAVTPFVDATHFSQRLFPPREYGLVLPAVAVVLFFGVALTAAAYHMAFAKESELQGLVVPSRRASPRRAGRRALSPDHSATAAALPLSRTGSMSRSPRLGAVS
jgi:dolichyl-phosphate mannosyltransferase polypeptide 2 regulatory subunit